MTAKELIDYLSHFDPDSDVWFWGINTKQKIGYQMRRVICITGDENPIIVMEIDKEEEIKGV